MEPAFASATKQRDFWLFYLATFACFFTVSQTAMLSVLLRDVRMSDQTAGVILGARYITAILGTLYSAVFIARIGVLNTAMLGIMVMVLSFLGLQVTYTEPASALAMRLLAGAGFGIFFPASFLYVRQCVTEVGQIQYMAILQTALVIPNLFGPGVAEWYLQHFGPECFFVVMGVPPLLVTLVVWLVASRFAELNQASTNSYIRLLGRREISLPLAASLIVGMVSGIFYSYMALWLRQSHINVSWYFAPYGVATLLSTFLLVRRVRDMPRQFVISAGFLSISLSAASLAAALTTGNAAVSGALFAAGYSVMLPTIIAWTCQYFPRSDHARSTALVNTAFNVGGVMGPLLVGWSTAAIGFVGIAGCIALVTGFMALLALRARLQLQPG
jgi:predicted MFS family arabinose efflux permease